MEDKHSDELLRDVLHEAAPPEFRAALLAETLHQVRRRKVQRQRNRVLLMVIGLFAVSLALWKTMPSPTPSLVARSPVVVDPLIIHTQPFPREMVVVTNPKSVENVLPSASDLAIVTTSPGTKLFEIIGDDELLTLLAGTAVVIRQKDSGAEVFFTPRGE